MVRLTFEKGDKVQIIADTYGHGLPIGSIQTIKQDVPYSPYGPSCDIEGCELWVSIFDLMGVVGWSFNDEDEQEGELPKRGAGGGTFLTNKKIGGNK